MNRRKVALILSFVYCGLGQVYRGKVLKGINFIVIYTLLIVSLFFSPASPFLHSLGLLVLLLMWLLGMVDAYIDDEILMERERWLIWQRLLTTMSVVVISGVVITLLMSWIPTFSAVSTGDRHLTRDVQSAAIPLENENAKHEDVTINTHSLKPTNVAPGTTLTIEYTINTPKTIAVGLGCSIQKAGASGWISDPDNDRVVNIVPGSSDHSRRFVLPPDLSSGKYDVIWGIWDSGFTSTYDSKLSSNALTIAISPTEDRAGNPEFFSIQVATFKNVENAEGFYRELLRKGYPARIEYPTEGRWHIVLVGKFPGERDAILLAKQLREREGISYVIVRRRGTEGWARGPTGL